jgi:hypothetical protein
VGRIKRAVQTGWEIPLESALALERELQQQLFQSEDAKEGLSAYGEKRKPAFEEITTMNFTPNEGFMLSRINGTWDIGSLIKISPIREADALMIFYKLYKDGIIALE